MFIWYWLDVLVILIELKEICILVIFISLEFCFEKIVKWYIDVMERLIIFKYDNDLIVE